jgi:hypothetical protein
MRSLDKSREFYFPDRSSGHLMRLTLWHVFSASIFIDYNFVDILFN